MFKRAVFVVILGLIFFGASAQTKKSDAVIVVGRHLSEDDSLKIREYFLSGIKEKAISKHNEAAGYFRAVLEIDPANAPALYELAALNHAQKDEGNAERFARKAATVSPENKWYWLLLADIYKTTGNLEQLVLVFDDLIRIDPDNDDYYFDKANALVLQNKSREADAVYAEIEEKFGTSKSLAERRQRLYQKTGDSEKAIVELEKLLESYPSDVRNYLSLANIYLKENKLDKALQILEQARAAQVDNAFIHLSLAEVYRRSGKTTETFVALKDALAAPELDIDSKIKVILSMFPGFKDPQTLDQAEELARIVAENHPADAKSHSLYGDVLLQANKLSRAKTSYQKALELNDRVYAIWEQLIRIEISTNDPASAIADGEEALTIFPNQAMLYFYTAIAYSQQHKYEKALSYLTTASELETENKEVLVQIYSSLGDTYNALKRFRESDQAYEKALQFDGDNTHVLNNYAYYLSLRGENLTKAAEMSKRSNELRPGNASFQDTYAWVLFKQKKYSEARNWIEKALKTNSGSGVQIEHYGDILYQLGEKEKALQQWLRARDKGVKSENLDKKINEKKFFE